MLMKNRSTGCCVRPIMASAGAGFGSMPRAMPTRTALRKISLARYGSPEQFRMEAMFDRMDAIGKAVLGVTIQCAQCHNHKFDPLTQEEYYRLFAFINNANEASVPVYTPDQQKQRADLFAGIRRIETSLKQSQPDWRQRMATWEDRIASGQPDWIVVRPSVDDISTGGQKYQPLPDGSLLAGGYAPTSLRAKFTVQTDVRN